MSYVLPYKGSRVQQKRQERHSRVILLIKLSKNITEYLSHLSHRRRPSHLLLKHSCGLPSGQFAAQIIEVRWIHIPSDRRIGNTYPHVALESPSTF